MNVKNNSSPIMLVFIPETIAIPNSGELINNDGPEGGSWAITRRLKKPARPQVHFINIPIVNNPEALKNLEK